MYDNDDMKPTYGTCPGFCKSFVTPDAFNLSKSPLPHSNRIVATFFLHISVSNRLLSSYATSCSLFVNERAGGRAGESGPNRG